MTFAIFTFLARIFFSNASWLLQIHSTCSDTDKLCAPCFTNCFRAIRLSTKVTILMITHDKDCVGILRVFKDISHAIWLVFMIKFFALLQPRTLFYRFIFISFLLYRGDFDT